MLHYEAEWLETSAGLLYVAGGHVQFEDDFAHWRDGFCRLLEISDDKARRLIEQAVLAGAEMHGKLPHETSPADRCPALASAVGSLFELPREPAAAYEMQLSWGTTFDGLPADTIFARSISGNRDRMVVGNRQCQFGWQISRADRKPVDATTVEYDRSYYDAPRQPHCGMRDYIRHDDWRLAKARRLIGTVLKAARESSIEWALSPGPVRVLDVGSATGYFRKAMSERGFDHYGIDVSADAIDICREMFGFETWHGPVFELPRFIGAEELRFQMITLWDTIEHFNDPLSVVNLLKTYLSHHGVLVIRTPSLTAFEADILGDMYYSYKLDHVRYFSPRSLTAMMEMAGLQEIYLETTSHIFKGLLGADHLYQMGKALRGADIVALYSLK